MKPIVGAERKYFVEQMQHIGDLQSGDRVRWKAGMRIAPTPDYNDVIEVAQVFETYRVREERDAYHEKDFTALFRDKDGDVIEFMFDSRRFERMTTKMEE